MSMIDRQSWVKEFMLNLQEENYYYNNTCDVIVDIKNQLNQNDTEIDDNTKFLALEKYIEMSKDDNSSHIIDEIRKKLKNCHDPLSFCNCFLLISSTIYTQIIKKVEALITKESNVDILAEIYLLNNKFFRFFAKIARSLQKTLNSNLFSFFLLTNKGGWCIIKAPRQVPDTEATLPRRGKYRKIQNINRPKGDIYAI